MFCQTCTKCQICYTKSACRGKTKPVLANLGNPGSRAKCLTHIEGGLHPPLSNQSKPFKITDYNHPCKSPQAPLSGGGIASAYEQKCSRVGKKSTITGFLQLAILGSKTIQQVETYTRSQQPQQISQDRKIQNGESRNNQDLPPDGGEWVMSIDF